MVDDDDEYSRTVPDIEPALKFNAETKEAISPNGHHGDEAILRAERKHREDVEVFKFRQELEDHPLQEPHDGPPAG